MIRSPSQKYQGFKPIHLTDRTWPDRVIDQAPVWMSTDLRDGNQALIEPMSVERKLKMYRMLLAIGFKEIEVAFPSASQTDYDFVRLLIEKNMIPDDVTIEVLTQAREELIARTIESLRGVRRAIIHLYNPISSSFARLVFNKDLAGIKEIALHGTRLIKQMTDAVPQIEWVFEYSPETFSSADLSFAKEVCDAVSEAWQPTPERKMIINLPATVEVATPNVYADQIEWMHRNLARRDSIILSVHPHNDRGSAVAAAELAMMAGAERVEGCLFGSGERTGNVDLVTLALNLYSQGIDPGLDFSDIDQVRQVAEDCTQLPVHPRHPYVGDLVFTAFSGSHQDAIKKGFAKRNPEGIWEVPYLTVDPADLSRSYDAVIRVNSQSGKGGVSFILQHEHGLDLPRRLQIEFSRVIQRFTDETGKEALSGDIYRLFGAEYLDRREPYDYSGHQLQEHVGGKVDANIIEIQVEMFNDGRKVSISGQGNGPIDAFANALKTIGIECSVVDYHEHAIGSGADAAAACYIELRIGNAPALFGVGIDKNIVSAALKAFLSAINRERAMASGTGTRKEAPMMIEQ